MKIRLVTNMGELVIELKPEQAPLTCANFEQRVREGFYDETLFHRVIKNFTIQGGGFNQHFVQKPDRKFLVKYEGDNGLQNVKGAVAMARRKDPDSASVQFFINLTDNLFLDHPGLDGAGYTVFGEVVQGLNIVEKIGEVKTGSRQGHMDVPVEDVVIEKAEIAEG